jgi:hypothetical protein
VEVGSEKMEHLTDEGKNQRLKLAFARLKGIIRR